MGSIIKASFKRHAASCAVLIMVVLYTTLVAIFNQKIDFLMFHLRIFWSIFWNSILIFFVSIIMYKFFEMLLSEKPKSPIKSLVKFIANILSEPERLFNLIVVMLIFSIFAASFTISKALIPYVNPFSWDLYLYKLDLLIFSDMLPHEYLGWMIDNKVILPLMEFSYQLWFYAYYGMLIFAAYYLHSREVSVCFLLSSIIAWSIGGIWVATIFSSAGPIFVDIHGVKDYLPHYSTLENGYLFMDSFALKIQQKLYSLYEGEKITSISAFPSMHVASATLMAILALSISRGLFLAAICFLCLIFLGSFFLLWHYFVYSVAGVIIGLISWNVAKVFVVTNRKL